MKGTIISVTILLAIGATCCLLLYNRAGPFSPGTSLSLSLGLDAAAATVVSATASSATPSSSFTSTSPSAAVTTTTAPITPSATVLNSIAQQLATMPATTATYLSVNGADMTGQDMTVTGDTGTPTTSQGTYGPAGCTAACNSNAGCVASVYSPSTKTCWIKSGLTPTGITGNADRVLQIPDKGATGFPKNNYNYPGNDTVAMPLPSAADCSTLCQALPWSKCQGSTYDSNAGTCHIKAPASNITAANNMVSWAKAYIPAYG
ncbi:hypothetical protein WJX74_008008 [Apatococcus lobatus]|uniref:Apple domain-containing protein n=1 Tax=Apatococcus lobatus TaxID=904363 RepID=A0AAW1Q2C7_9CHLO